MKRYLLSICLFSLLLHCNAASFKIKGTVEGAKNGTFVYLQKIEKGELIKVDSAVVRKSSFNIKGKTDSAVLRYLTYMADDMKYSTEIFLSDGDVNVILGKECTVNGTTENDTYQTCKAKIIRMNKNLESQYKKLKEDNTLSNEAKAQLANSIKRSEIEEMLYIQNATSSNISSIVGVYLLGKYANAFNVDQIKDLLAKVPKEYSDMEAILDLKNPKKEIKSIDEGEKFKDFTLIDNDGNSIKLSEIIKQSKYTLLDFWASWCAPCRKEMPNLKQNFADFKDKGFNVIGFSLDDNKDRWQGAVKQLALPWNQYSDLKAWKSECVGLYGFDAIPFMLLISQDGTIVAKNLRGEALREKLNELFK